MSGDIRSSDSEVTDSSESNRLNSNGDVVSSKKGDQKKSQES